MESGDVIILSKHIERLERENERLKAIIAELYTQSTVLRDYLEDLIDTIKDKTKKL